MDPRDFLSTSWRALSPHHSSSAKIVASGCSIPVLGWIDYATGFELAFAPFYFVPIAFAAWYGGRGPGLGASILCAVTWLLADVLSGHEYSSPYLNLWNTLIRLLSFLTILALVLDRRRLLLMERIRAHSDPLTGLANHRGFMEALKIESLRSRRHCHPLTVAYLDLDNFKQVNDREGHAEGDRVLETVATTLRSELRGEDVAARLGGDEFALLLPETEPEEASAAAHRIHGVLARALLAAGFDVTVSLGCVTYVQAPDNSDEILRSADAMMYRVKRAGKNAVLVRVHANEATDSAALP